MWEAPRACGAAGAMPRPAPARRRGPAALAVPLALAAGWLLPPAACARAAARASTLRGLGPRVGPREAAAALRRAGWRGQRWASVARAAGGVVLPPPALEGSRHSLMLDVGRTKIEQPDAPPLGDGRQPARDPGDCRVPPRRCAAGRAGRGLLGRVDGASRQRPRHGGPVVRHRRRWAAQVGGHACVPEHLWRVVEDVRRRGWAIVEFDLETSGFHRQTIWLPKTRLHFKAKVYGTTLSGGAEPPFLIRESTLSLGVFLAVVLGLIIGPVGWMMSVIAFVVREVSICVGTWTSRTINGDVDNESASPVTLRGDVPELWR
ncbi:unnamed protein product [Prorocentrum cordatum]|uniref:Uncharacterized protein n=1 Tax=Prorocentrum cordatum TaxID=2364126 RepID=A0ABN9QVP1_9DINO|nr:unnamed protein product [Polarella glacialis]